MHLTYPDIIQDHSHVHNFIYLFSGIKIKCLDLTLLTGSEFLYNLKIFKEDR